MIIQTGITSSKISKRWGTRQTEAERVENSERGGFAQAPGINVVAIHRHHDGGNEGGYPRLAKLRTERVENMGGAGFVL